MNWFKRFLVWYIQFCKGSLSRSFVRFLYVILFKFSKNKKLYTIFILSFARLGLRRRKIIQKMFSSLSEHKIHRPNFWSLVLNNSLYLRHHWRILLQSTYCVDCTKIFQCIDWLGTCWDNSDQKINFFNFVQSHTTVR